MRMWSPHLLMIMNSNKEDIRGNEEARFIVSFIAEKSICHCSQQQVNDNTLHSYHHIKHVKENDNLCLQSYTESEFQKILSFLFTLYILSSVAN